MRRVLLLLSLAVPLLVAVVACSRATSESDGGGKTATQAACAAPAAVAANAPMQTLKVPVEGMTCASCAGGVKEALKGIDGVRRVEVRLAERDALVDIIAGTVTPECLTTTVAALGFKTSTPTVLATAAP